MNGDVLVRISADLPSDAQLQLDGMLDRHNMGRTGIRDARALSVMAHDPGGRFLGGLHGYTWGGYCEIKTIFVAELERGKGLGSRLLDAAEAEALHRDCRQVVLTTHGFQAPGFYERLGYHCVAAIADCPLGDSYRLMTKRLGRDCI